MAHLIGVSSTATYTVSSYLANGDLPYYEDFVASASGTVTDIGIYVSSVTTASSFKLILCDASGNHLAVGTVAWSAAGWHNATISGVTITAGVTYRLVVVANGYWYPYTDSATWSTRYGSGTYASPANPLVDSGNVNAGNLALRVQGTTGPTVGTIGTDDEVIQGETGVTFQTTNATGTVTSVTIGGVTQTVTSDVSV